MWSCPKCRQKVDDQFEVCWKCGTTLDGVEDPEFFAERDGRREAPRGPEAAIAPESLVTLIKCSLPGEAHAIRVRLESEDIPVFLFDEFTVTMDWLLSNAIGGVKVQVPEPYLERARAILGIVEEEQERAAAEEDEQHEEPDHEPRPEEGIIDLEARRGIIDKSVHEGIAEKNGGDV